MRLSGSYYSIPELIELMASKTASPDRIEQNLSRLLFGILFVAFSVLGANLGGFWSLVFTYAVHEAGLWLSMVLVGWSRVKLSFALPGPVSWAKEDSSAGRKAAVALGGIAAGILAASCLGIYGLSVDSAFLISLSRSLYLFSGLNLLPLKPFDGYIVIEHLLFVRFPKLEMFYLGTVGAVLFVSSCMVSYSEHESGRFPFCMIFLMFYGAAMFVGLKKCDNMAEMIVRLRREGSTDLESGQYSVRMIKRMEFSLSVFELPNVISVSTLLREVWDRAWEQPPKLYETLFAIALYLLLLIAFMQSSAAMQLIVELRGLIGL